MAGNIPIEVFFHNIRVVCFLAGFFILFLFCSCGPSNEPVPTEKSSSLAKESAPKAATAALSTSTSACLERRPFELKFVVKPVDFVVREKGGFLLVGDVALFFLDGAGGLSKTVELSDEPKCVAEGPDGEIAVGIGGRVEIFDASGAFIKKTRSFNEKSALGSVAFWNGAWFAADYGNRTVLRYDADGAPSIWLPEDADIIIRSPYFDITPSASGGLWVVNPGRHRLDDYDKDAKVESFWGGAGMSETKFCGCCNPIHIAVTEKGDVLTAEKGLPRVKLYRPDGLFAATVAGSGDFDEGTVGLVPAAGPCGAVFVLDPERRQIRRFVFRR